MNFKVGDLIRWYSPRHLYTVEAVHQDGSLTISWEDQPEEKVSAGSTRMDSDSVQKYARKLSKLERAIK